MRPYPVFLVGLERRSCVVVGGNPEAERKVESLLECGGHVTVVAVRVQDAIREHAAAGRVRWVRRGYESGDLRGAFVVFATEPDPVVRAAVFEEAEAGGILVNVVDDVPRCNFIAGSVVRRGKLTVAISTSGAAPALAVRLRERLERELGEGYEELLDRLTELRPILARAVPDRAERRESWYRVVDRSLDR